MATTTPNFGWAVPTSTDLVKDGAVAIETLGDAIDASLVDLKGGTTGQVLSKASNTDMDFTWVTDAAGDITGVTAGTGISGGGTSGTVTVTNSMATAITTAGDLIKGTGSGTFDRLGIGSTGQVLTVTAGAPAWATPSAGGSTFSGCLLLRSGNQSIANNTDVAVLFDNEGFDTDSFHSTSTNTSRITIPSGKGGYYQFNYNVMWAANSSGLREVMLFKNGTRVQYYTALAITSGSQSQAITMIQAGAVGDYFELYVFQNSGGSLNLQGTATAQGSTSFSCSYLGA